MDEWRTKVAILLLLSSLSSLRASSPSNRFGYSVLFIDCGSLYESNATEDGIFKWRTDDEFIKIGQNYIFNPNNISPLQFTTLRFFPKGNQNCYSLYLSHAYEKYLFRAGFYYGNYDGLSRPPNFRLEIDGNLWANVTGSMGLEPVNHEMIYIPKRQEVRVCLVRENEEDVPFISSLEVDIIYDGYSLMDNGTALYLHERINYGANKSVEQTIGFYDERFDRIWKSRELPEYFNIHPEFIPDGYVYSENSPPWAVMAYAIQAQNLTKSIYLSVDFSPATPPLQAYFVFYFMDPIYRYPWNQTGIVEIYVDGVRMAVTDVPNINMYKDQIRVVTLFPVPVVGGTANVTISPANGSRLAPLLNAMEVFSAIDATNGGDLLNLSPALFIVFFTLIGVLVS